MVKKAASVRWGTAVLRLPEVVLRSVASYQLGGGVRSTAAVPPKAALTELGVAPSTWSATLADRSVVMLAKLAALTSTWQAPSAFSRTLPVPPMVVGL